VGGTQLVNAEELLKQWLAHYHFERHKLHFYLVQAKDPIGYLHKVCKEVAASYGLTGFSAANRVMGHPLVYHAPPMVYLWPESLPDGKYRGFLAKLENNYDFIPVTKKGNLIILESYLKETVLYGRVAKDKKWVVSPLQLFLDLYALAPDGFVIKELAAYWQKHHIPYESQVSVS